LKSAASYVIVTAYLVPPRGTFPFCRFLKLFRFATKPFLHPVLAFSTFCSCELPADPEKLCLRSVSSSAVTLAGSRLDRNRTGPDCSGIILFLSGGSFLRQLSPSLSLARLTKTCLLSSPAETNVHYYFIENQ